MFDIDKLNIYWSDSKSLFGNKAVRHNIGDDISGYKKEQLFNVLLQLEKQILLHPRNAHMLFMPVIDDLLKKEAFDQIIIKAKGQKKDSTTYMQALTPQKNVEKAIHFIKSKLGVGVVALDITGHSVFGSENINIEGSYFNPSKEYKETSTKLLFEGLEGNYSLSSMHDANNRVISEVQSQTMNSQVDAGKDPYAVLLGINNQTLGIMMYLVRRQVPVITVLKFLSQPMIQKYLVEQRRNESVINKQRGEEISKDKLIDSIYGFATRPQLDRNQLFNDYDLDQGIRKNVIDKSQHNYFEYFLALVDETGAFNDLKSGMTVDTKGKKDKAAVENFDTLWERIQRTQIISTEHLNTIRDSSVLKPFFKAQQLYGQLYDPFYAIHNSNFAENIKYFKEMMADKQKGAFNKEKVRSTIDNDFMLFLIQNANPDFNQDNFNKLFGFNGNQSLASEIKALMKNPLYANNIALRALFPLLNIDKDAMHQQSFDVVRLFERELSTIDVNDFIDAVKDIRDEISEDLYKSIVQLSIYQAGFNNSPFSLHKILPTFKSSVREKGELKSFENDYLREIQSQALKSLEHFKIGSNNVFDSFVELFYRNNVKFLPTKYSQYSTIKFFYTWSPKDKKRHLFYKPNNVTDKTDVSILGGTYFKRYFVSNAMGLGATSATIMEPQINTNVQTYIGRVEELQPNEVFVFGSNPIGINGNIAKNTGGAALVANKKGWVTPTERLDNKLSLSGKAWGITTVTTPGAKLSKSPAQIQEGIKKMYDHATANPDKRFLVAYMGKTGFNLNGYSNAQLAAMFGAYNIPSNVVFEKDFATLLKSSKTVVNEDEFTDYEEIAPTQLSLPFGSIADDVFNEDDIAEAERLKQECKGTNTKVVK